MNLLERCRLCGNLLTFVGFTEKGERVTTCVGTLTHYQEGVGTAMVPCNQKGFVVVHGEVLNSSQVKWHDREEFKPRAGYTATRRLKSSRQAA